MTEQNNLNHHCDTTDNKLPLLLHQLLGRLKNMEIEIFFKDHDSIDILTVRHQLCLAAIVLNVTMLISRQLVIFNTFDYHYNIVR